MHVRTGHTHPLRIDELRVDGVGGRIGITFCPGMRGDSEHGAPRARDVTIDVRAFRDWGADALLTLIEDHGFAFHQSRGLGPAVRAAGMNWHNLRFEVDVSDRRFEEG